MQWGIVEIVLAIILAIGICTAIIEARTKHMALRNRNAEIGQDLAEAPEKRDKKI